MYSSLSSVHEIMRLYRLPVLLVCFGIGISIAGFVIALHHNMQKLEQGFNWKNQAFFHRLECGEQGHIAKAVAEGEQGLRSLINAYSRQGWEKEQEVYIFDAMQPNKPLLLHQGPPLPALTGPQIHHYDQVIGRAAFYYSGVLKGPGFRREVVFVPTPAYLSRAAGYLPWMTLGFGIFMTAIISAFTFSLVTRNLYTQRIVEERTKALAQSNQELENFGNVLSHDMKAPIRTVRGFMEMVTEDIQNGQYDQIDEHYQFVERAIDHMEALITALHEYTQLEREEQEYETVSMQTALEGALNNLHMWIKDTGASVTHEKLPEVRGSQPQMVQLLQNLIGNSIKYCKSGTKPAIHIQAEQRHGVWIFSVADNGIGIAQEAYDRIFSPFKRLHSQDEYEGTGLGLATCKKVVRRHKGKIWCESVEGKGTTFYFTLPVITEH